MTINVTAAWLLSLYIATAEKQGANRKLLSGTTQNDITKEYLSRGTYIYPPGPSLKLTTDIIKFTTQEVLNGIRQIFVLIIFKKRSYQL